MSELTAEDFYNEIKEFVDKPQFTKLTGTGISSDYKSVFEFAEAYFDARMEANGATTGEKQCNLPVVSQQRELLKFFAEQLRPSLEIDIGFNYITEDNIEECLKNFNCG